MYFGGQLLRLGSNPEYALGASPTGGSVSNIPTNIPPPQRETQSLISYQLHSFSSSHSIASDRLRTHHSGAGRSDGCSHSRGPWVSVRTSAVRKMSHTNSVSPGPHAPPPTSVAFPKLRFSRPLQRGVLFHRTTGQRAAIAAAAISSGPRQPPTKPRYPTSNCRSFSKFRCGERPRDKTRNGCPEFFHRRSRRMRRISVRRRGIRSFSYFLVGAVHLVRVSWLCAEYRCCGKLHPTHGRVESQTGSSGRYRDENSPTARPRSYLLPASVLSLPGIISDKLKART